MSSFVLGTSGAVKTVRAAQRLSQQTHIRHWPAIGKRRVLGGGAGRVRLKAGRAYGIIPAGEMGWVKLYRNDAPNEVDTQAQLVETGEQVLAWLDFAHGNEQISDGLDVMIAKGWDDETEGDDLQNCWRIIAADCEPDAEPIPVGDWTYV